MSKEQIILLITTHIATRGSTPELEELLAKLNTSPALFELKHLEALSRVVFVHAKQPKKY